MISNPFILHTLRLPEFKNNHYLRKFFSLLNFDIIRDVEHPVTNMTSINVGKPHLYLKINHKNKFIEQLDYELKQH